MELVTDIATIRSATRVLAGQELRDRNQDVPLAGIDIAALGLLLEGLCFSDAINVPDFEHVLLPQVAARFGDAVRINRLADGDRAAIVTGAREWLTEWPNIENLVRLLGGNPVTHLAGNSSNYLVLQAIGAKGKYDSRIVRWVHQLRTSDAEHLRRKSHLYHDREWDPRAEGWLPKSAKPSPLRYLDVPRPRGLFDANRDIDVRDSELSALLANRGLPPLHVGTHPELSPPYEHWRGGSEMMQFCANLAWIAFRTMCYSSFAASQSLSYSPHPLRAQIAGFAAAGIAEPSMRSESQQWFTLAYLERLDAVYEEAHGVSRAVGNTALVRFPYPNVLPYLIRKAGSREHLLEAAYELRDSKGAVSLRRRMAAFEQELRRGDLKAAVRYRNELDRVTSTLRQRLDLDPYEPTRAAFSISLGFASVSMPLGLPRKASEFLTGITSPWLAILWNVFDALASADALGDLYEALYDGRPDE